MKHAIAGFLVAIAVVRATPLFTADTYFFVPVACCLSALFMPTTHALLGYIGFFGVVALLAYAQHLYAMSLPSYAASPSEAIAFAFAALIALGVGTAAILNLLCRFAFRKLRAAQQGTAGDARDARA